MNHAAVRQPRRPRRSPSSRRPAAGGRRTTSATRFQNFTPDLIGRRDRARCGAGLRALGGVHAAALHAGCRCRPGRRSSSGSSPATTVTASRSTARAASWRTPSSRPCRRRRRQRHHGRRALRRGRDLDGQRPARRRRDRPGDGGRPRVRPLPGSGPQQRVRRPDGAVLRRPVPQGRQRRHRRHHQPLRRVPDRARQLGARHRPADRARGQRGVGAHATGSSPEWSASRTRPTGTTCRSRPR